MSADKKLRREQGQKPAYNSIFAELHILKELARNNSNGILIVFDILTNVLQLIQHERNISKNLKNNLLSALSFKNFSRSRRSTLKLMTNLEDVQSKTQNLLRLPHPAQIYLRRRQLRGCRLQASEATKSGGSGWTCLSKRTTIGAVRITGIPRRCVGGLRWLGCASRKKLVTVAIS